MQQRENGLVGGLLGATSRQSWDLKGLLVSVLGWLAIIFPMSQVAPGVVAVGERGVSEIAPVGGGEMAVEGGERHRLDGPRSSWLCRLSIFSSVTWVSWLCWDSILPF